MFASIHGILSSALNAVQIFDLTSAKQEDGPLNFSVEDPIATGMRVSDDGTKVYILGNTDAVYQYNLSTAWDTSTGVYSGNTLNVLSQATTGLGLEFGDGGTKLYVTDVTARKAFQYTLSPAWDLGSAVYANKESLAFNSQDLSPFGVAFSSDGTVMYMIGNQSRVIYQYTVGTAWDISTATYASKSASVSTQATSPYDIAFSDAGLKMHIMDQGTDTIYTYDLGTAWDLGGTVTYTGSFLNVTDRELTPDAIDFNADGTILFVVGQSSDRCHRYDLSTGFDVSSGVPISKELKVGGEENIPHSATFSVDGTKLYVGGQQTDLIHQYDLSTPWNVNTATYSTNSFDSTAQGTLPYGIFFKPDGLKMYVLLQSNRTVFEYDLGTAWSLGGTVTYTGNSDAINVQDPDQRGLFFGDGGTKMYAMGGANDTIYQYTLGTAWDMSTSTYSNLSKSVNLEDVTPMDMHFTADGITMYMLGATSHSVYQYTLATPWKIDTASYDGILGSVPEEGNPNTLMFSSNNERLYVLGTTRDDVIQYILTP